MQSDISQLTAEIFKDATELLKELLKEIKLKIKEKRAADEDSRFP
jgi:hypothetical protein